MKYGPTPKVSIHFACDMSMILEHKKTYMKYKYYSHIIFSKHPDSEIQKTMLITKILVPILNWIRTWVLSIAQTGSLTLRQYSLEISIFDIVLKTLFKGKHFFLTIQGFIFIMPYFPSCFDFLEIFNINVVF